MKTMKAVKIMDEKLRKPCSRCGGRFHEGETIRKHRGGAVHNFPCSRVARLRSDHVGAGQTTR
jgi:hypothetical protein